MDKPRTSPQKPPQVLQASVASFFGSIPYAELSTALAATVGWLLVTWFFASLLTPMVWALGAGLYLLSLAGFRLVGVLCWRGLYELSQPEDEN